MRHAAKPDGNQTAVVRYLRAAGLKVHILKMPADLLVAYGGITVIVEVKDPVQPPSARHLTDAEMAFWLDWRTHGLYVVVQSEDDCRLLVAAIKAPLSSASYIARFCDGRMRDYIRECYTDAARDKMAIEHKLWRYAMQDLGV